MWQYTGNGESIPGIPREDIPDDLFEQLSERYDRQFTPDQAGSLKRCGLYRHVKDAAPKAAAKEE